MTGFGADEGTARAPACGESGPADDAPGPHAWSYSGTSLSLTRRGGADADDRYGATGTLSALDEGGALVVGGVAVGTVTRNSGGRLLLTFSGPNASEDCVDAVLRQVTYANAARDRDARVELHWALAGGQARDFAGAFTVEGYTVVTVDGAPIWRSARQAA